MDVRLVEWLQCPICEATPLLTHGDVASDGQIVTGALTCRVCDAVYPIEDGIPFLLSREARRIVDERTTRVKPDTFGTYQTEGTPAVGRLLERLARSAEVVLDLGSGRAPYLPLFAGDSICVDLFPQFLRDLPRTPGERARVHPICASATQVPVRRGVADLVFASELIEHLRPTDARRALEEWPRLANQWCVVDTPNGYEGSLLTRLRHFVYRTRTLTQVEHPELPELDHHSTFSPDDFRAAGYECHGAIGWVSRKRFRLGPIWDLYDAITWRFPSIAGTLIAVAPGRARSATDGSMTDGPDDAFTPEPTTPALDAQLNKSFDDPRALVVAFGSVVDPRHGMAVRARSVSEALADLGFRVSVISSAEPETAPPASIETLHVLKRKLHLGWSRELVREARVRAREAHVIVVESALLLPAVLAGRPKVPILWDTNECETLHYSRLERSLNNRLRQHVWRQIERWAVSRSDIVIAVSEAERRWWARLFPGSRRKLAVVPHRSLAMSADGKARAHLERICNTQLRRPALLFVGNLAAKHNAAAAEWLLAELAPRLPFNCSLLLAGPGTNTLQAPDSARAQVIRLGSVRDINVVIGGADVCLAPLAAGAGVKTKILDYLAHGKIVFATPIAMEGLEEAPGVRIAELELFTSCVLDYLSASEADETAWAQGQSQRTWVLAHHGPARVKEHLRVALERVGLKVP